MANDHAQPGSTEVVSVKFTPAAPGLTVVDAVPVIDDELQSGVGDEALAIWFEMGISIETEVNAKLAKHWASRLFVTHMVYLK